MGSCAPDETTPGSLADTSPSRALEGTPLVSPVVSVVICYLNGANFIAEAISSVLGQDCADWELLLVDDGSSDESPAIARRHAASDPRIRTMAHPDGRNHGLAASRKLGADAARGRYLLFLDHDDVLRPFTLSRLVAPLEAHRDIAATFARTLYWAWDPGLDKDESESTFAPFGEGKMDGRTMLRDLMLADTRHPAQCSIAFRREVYLAVRGDRVPWHGMYEDTALLMMLLARHDVWLLDEVLSSYRMHADSMCTKAEAEGSHRTEGLGAARVRFMRWAAWHIPMDWRSRLLALKVWIKGEARLRLQALT